MPFAANSIVEYTVTGDNVVNHDNVNANAVKFADAAGNPAAPFFVEGSRLIGKVIAVSAGAPHTYTVQFGPVAAGAGAAALQVLNIPEAHLLSRTEMTNIFVTQPLIRGGSRKRRQSKKRKNHKNHNNNQ